MDVDWVLHSPLSTYSFWPSPTRSCGQVQTQTRTVHPSIPPPWPLPFPSPRGLVYSASSPTMTVTILRLVSGKFFV